MNPCATFQSPTLRGGAEHRFQSFSPNEAKRILHLNHFWGTVSRSFNVKVCTPFAEDKDLTEEEQEQLKDFNKVFINPKIINEEGNEWAFSEGCLSIPDIREDVFRQETVTFEYQDENFEKHQDTLTGVAARVFQHEYDHLIGQLYVDHIKDITKLSYLDEYMEYIAPEEEE